MDLRRLVAIFLSILVALVISESASIQKAFFHERWAHFKTKYHKKHYNMAEDNRRLKIFNNNMEKIQYHNFLHLLGLSSYSMDVNEYADMTNTEFVRVMNKLLLKPKVKPDNKKPKTTPAPTTTAEPPTQHEVDWRQEGYVTPVKNQGDCGACYAFSALGALEGQHFKATGELVSLSEQNVIDCSDNWGNQGCHGGFITAAYQYVIDNGGVATEASYPYLDKDRKCAFATASVGATMLSYEMVTSGDENALKVKVAEIGPISAAMDASSENFQFYKSGVYDEPSCSTNYLDHAVVIVGYGTTSNGLDYWIAKNSWGTTWGDDGYVYMSRNKDNQCGVATYASYPIV